MIAKPSEGNSTGRLFWAIRRYIGLRIPPPPNFCIEVLTFVSFLSSQGLHPLKGCGSWKFDQLPSLELTAKVKMDGWITTFLLGRPVFKGELLASGRVLYPSTGVALDHPVSDHAHPRAVGSILHL